ncbi:MAG: hypothetical protein ACHQ9S_09605 [Candidatus Binatia bacterium]
MDQELRDGLQSIQASLAELQSPSLAAAAVADRATLMEGKLTEAVRVVGLDALPTYVLAAMPRRLIDLPTLFQSRNAPLVKLIDNPPELRRSGFDLATDESSRIIAGRLRRAVLTGYKLLELHRDGALIFVARGDDTALCWGRLQRQSDAPLINQLFLIETTALLLKLAFAVYRDHLPADDYVDFHLRFLRMRKDAKLCRLEAGPLQSFGLDVREAPDESGSFTATAKIGDEAPQETAFRLLGEVYVWFGFEAEQIPYASTKDPRAIDEDAIVVAGR